ncbi:MAG: iron-containing alcohol dehydrogenase, partial [Byssovorax sp.]
MSGIKIWSFPTRVLYGVGAVDKVGEEAKRLGAKRALIVTDKGVVKFGLVAPVEEALHAAGIETAIFDDVLGNPIEKNVHDGVAAFRAHDADIVIAVGGGSPLDVGKLIRLGVNHTRPLVDYDDATGGDAFITADVAPMIAVPTTAGTGSEVGRSGVVTLDVNHRKTVIFSPHLMANVAILDPEMTHTMPAHVTAATGYDALTHCLEAFVSKGEHPMADGIALEGLRLVAKHLERAVSHGDDLEARGGMLQAAMMGAVAFQKGLGACHSLAPPLSSECGLHHGLANAYCLPAVIEFNAELAAERLAHVAVIFGGEPSAKG